MAKERVFTYRNTGTAESPVWEKWFQKTIADAVLMSDADDEEQTIVDYVDQKIAELIGGAPGTYDTLKEIADYIEAHEDVAAALNQAIANKADKNHTHADATQSSSGFMSGSDKKKLDGVANGATANDTLYKNQTPSTVAVGGVPKGYVPPSSGVEAVEMINKMLHAYVAPTASASASPTNGGTFEIGTSQQVTAVTVNITLGSASISKIEVLDGSDVLGTLASGIKAGTNTVTLNSALTVTSNKQLKVKITDSENKSITVNTGAFTFVNPYYYGAIASGAEINETTVKGTTKSVSVKGNKSFNYTCSNQKMLFAYPKSYGALSKILDANSFDVTDTFTRTEVTVNGVSYYVYTNAASTVSGFKMTFNY